MMELTPNELVLYSVLLIGFASVLLDIHVLVYNKRELFYYQFFFLFVAAGVLNNHYTMISANTKQSFLNDEAIICTQPTLRVVKRSEGFILKGEYLINKEQILDLKDCKALESKEGEIQR
jgi:hypothetical protein